MESVSSPLDPKRRITLSGRNVTPVEDDTSTIELPPTAKCSTRDGPTAKNRPVSRLSVKENPAFEAGRPALATTLPALAKDPVTLTPSENSFKGLISRVAAAKETRRTQHDETTAQKSTTKTEKKRSRGEGDWQTNQSHQKPNEGSNPAAPLL